MTQYTTTALQLSLTSQDPAKVLPSLDKLLTDGAGSILTIFDLDFSYSYPGGAPINGQVIKDLTRSDDLQARVPGTGAGPSYAGGGFDLSAITYGDAGVRAPAAVWADIYADDNDFFAWCAYFRMPTSDDWNALGAYVGMFNAGVSFSSAPDPLTIAQFNGNLVAARQTSIGAATTRTLTPSSNHYGKVCQLYFWRNSDGDGFRMAPLVPDSGPTIDTSLAVSITGALGANNSADYSACVAQWGAPLGWNGRPMSAAQAAASNTRLYRGWLANLNGASVDPIWLADRDMQRVLDRYIASASMHGGTSLIFV